MDHVKKVIKKRSKTCHVFLTRMRVFVTSIFDIFDQLLVTEIDGETPPKIFSLHDAGFTNAKNLRWRLPIDFCNFEISENRWGDAT